MRGSLKSVIPVMRSVCGQWAAPKQPRAMDRGCPILIEEKNDTAWLRRRVDKPVPISELDKKRFRQAGMAKGLLYSELNSLSDTGLTVADYIIASESSGAAKAAWMTLLEDDVYMEQTLQGRDINGRKYQIKRIDHWILHNIGLTIPEDRVAKQIQKNTELWVAGIKTTLWKLLCIDGGIYRAIKNLENIDVKRPFKDPAPLAVDFYNGAWLVVTGESLDDWPFAHALLAFPRRVAHRLTDPEIISKGIKFNEASNWFELMVGLRAEGICVPIEWWSGAGFINFIQTRGYMPLNELARAVPAALVLDPKVLNYYAELSSWTEVIQSVEDAKVRGNT